MPARRTTAVCLIALASCIAPRTPRAVQRQLDGKVDRLLTDTRNRTMDERRRTLVTPRRRPPELASDAQSGAPTPPAPVEPEPLPVSYDLAGSLAQAFRTNRTMLTQRESLYLTAVSLIGTRQSFSPQISSALSYLFADSELGERSQSASANASVSQILPSGGTATLSGQTGWDEVLLQLAEESDDLGAQASAASERFGSSFTSSVSLGLVQPLLRGSGYYNTHESLIQAERNLIYGIRSFLRFREGFAITVAERYYSLVQQQKSLENQRKNLDVSVFGRRKAEALNEIGRANQLEVLRARRQELEDRNRTIAALESYQLAVDQFKVFLGIETKTPIEILPEDPPFIEVDWELESAIDAAFDNRLDYLTLKEQLQDSARGVRLVRDRLRSDLDLTAGYTIAAAPDASFAHQNLDDTSWSAGITWSPAIDRRAENNSYRSAQIGYVQTIRSLDLFEDNLVIEIRSAFRQLQRIKQSVGIQRQLIEDQEKNLRKAQIEFDQGRASNREVFDAQQSLVNAQNSLIAEQVNYEIARLRLMESLGILFVDENGKWSEP